jgi:hypothetical protein
LEPFFSDPDLFRNYKIAERAANARLLELLAKVATAWGITMDEVLQDANSRRKIFIPQTLEAADRAELEEVRDWDACAASERNEGVEDFERQISHAIDIIDPYEFVFPSAEALFASYRLAWPAPDGDGPEWLRSLNAKLELLKAAAADVTATPNGEFRFN